MPLIKEHWVFIGGSWNMPGLKMEASEHQSFPPGWQALAEEWKRFSSRYFESQEKNTLMRILRRMILPKNTNVSTGFFWQVRQISAAPSDCMKLCMWLNLFISAFWSSVSVTVALCIQFHRLSAPDTRCYSALCFQHYFSEIPSLPKHWLCLP